MSDDSVDFDDPKDPKLFRISLYAGLAAILLLSAAAAYGPFDEWRYQPAKTFDAARWHKPDLKYRYSALQILIREVIKPGMTEGEVVGLLGTPNAVTADDDYQYEVQQPGWRYANWTGGGLLIRFDRGRRVIEAVDHTVVD